MFTEDNAVEKLLIKTLVENGWTYIDREHLGRDKSDVFVDNLLKNALIKLNPEIQEDTDRADEVIHKLRTIILSVQPHNLIAQNEVFKKALFEKNSYPFGENGRMTSIKVFDCDDISQNSFVVTNQWVFPREDGGKRLDLVLLINGIPVVIGELKTPVRQAISWADGAGDISAYEKSIPQMFVSNVLSFATEGKFFRYGSVGMPINLWGPWHDSKNKAEGTLADVQRSVAKMLTPEIVMDIMQYFTVFATDKKHRKIKIVCRYQQYEGANLIVERVKAGYPKKGLIWHFQGSGKSLLMVFAAQKLRMTKELKNPAVVIVDDRIDLETQITKDFNTTDIPNLESADSKDKLIKFFEHDIRKILITTIFKFGDVDGVLNPNDNIIVLVDEAHRTQEGDLGIKMRQALPNAFFFGLTGTPINKADRNTFFTFGAKEDKSGYLSKYSFSDSLRDKATLPLFFEPVPIELHIDQEAINEEFDAIAESLSASDKAEIVKRVRVKSLFTAPKRVEDVCTHIANHFQTKVEPNGFKAQVVCYDRDTCLLYKEELDRILGKEASTVVIDTNNDKGDKYKAYRRDRDGESKILDRFRDPADPLKIVIVTSKLLTGFDAPILQVMYLDKPMRDHTLLQAICRTNRLFGHSKTHGLIVDYIGIFDDVAKALQFDDKSVEKSISNLNVLKERLPMLMKKCLGHFPCVDRSLQGFEGLMAAQECIRTNDLKDRFAADFSVLSNAWEALSPDICLKSYKNDYIWLSRVYESVRPCSGNGNLLWMALGAKTIDLVHKNIQVQEVRCDEDILELDADMIDQYIQGKKNAKKKAQEIMINLIPRIRKHAHDPRFIKLGEKLELLREQHEQGLMTSIEFLKYLLQLAKETVEAEKQVETKEEREKGIEALTELFNSIKNPETPIIVERIVGDIDKIVKLVRFPGWQNTTAGKQEVTKALRKIIWLQYKIKDSELFEKAYSYVEIYY